MAKTSKRTKSDDQFKPENIWFSNRMHDWRTASHITQAETARRLGVTRSTISNWEYRSCMPNPYMVGKMCEAFGITPDQFYGVNSDEEDASLHILMHSLSREGKAKVLDYAKLIQATEGV